MTVAAVASLVVGVIIGFVGQRSRMCFVAGIRDFIIVRDTFLLKGLIAFGVVAWIAFPISGLLGGEFVGEFGRPVLQTVVLAAVGGFGVGYVSVGERVPVPATRPRRPGDRQLNGLPIRILRRWRCVPSVGGAAGPRLSAMIAADGGSGVRPLRFRLLDRLNPISPFGHAGCVVLE